MRFAGTLHGALAILMEARKASSGDATALSSQDALDSTTTNPA